MFAPGRRYTSHAADIFSDGLIYMLKQRHFYPVNRQKNFSVLHKTLTDPLGAHLADETGLQWIEAFHEPGILFGGERLYFLRVSRPLKAEAGYQPLIQEQEAVTFKKEAFDPVGLSATE